MVNALIHISESTFLLFDHSISSTVVLSDYAAEACILIQCVDCICAQYTVNPLNFDHPIIELCVVLSDRTMLACNLILGWIHLYKVNGQPSYCLTFNLIHCVCQPVIWYANKVNWLIIVILYNFGFQYFIILDFGL